MNKKQTKEFEELVNFFKTYCKGVFGINVEVKYNEKNN